MYRCFCLALCNRGIDVRIYTLRYIYLFCIVNAFNKMGKDGKAIRAGGKKTVKDDKKFDLIEEVLEPRRIVRTLSSPLP